jgi:hypothetical protein
VVFTCIYIPCRGLFGIAGPMWEGGIRYWAVQGGWVGVEGGGIKEACLVADRCMLRLSRFSFNVSESELRLLYFILCRRGFHALLRCKPSSLFMLFGCNSI